MPKRPLREVIDLSALTDEERLKLEINEAKSKKGFGGITTSLKIQDSISQRSVNSDAIKSSEATAEESEEEDQPSDPSSVSSEEEEVDDEPTAPQVDMSSLQELITNAIAPLQEQITSTQSELEAQRTRNQELETQLNAANQEVSKAQRNTQAVEDLSKLLGQPAKPQQGKEAVEMPNVNTITSPSGDVLNGRLAEFFEVRDASGVRYMQTKKGNYVPAYDTTDVDRWVVENGLNNKSSRAYRETMKELTAWGKKHGLFRGNKMISEGEMRAATTGANIPGGFLEVLSSIMRTSARPGLVFWQFPYTAHRFDRGDGEVVDIPRAAYPEIATDSNERLLSGSGTFVPIDNSNTNIRTGIVKMQLQEYGRGRPEAPPIAVPRFVSEYSMIPLMNLLERDLFWDYYHWEDLAIRELWRKTSAVRYANGSTAANTTLETAAANVAVGGGVANRHVLRNLRLELDDARVVPLPDGNYGLVTHPTFLKQLKDDYDNLWDASTEGEVENLVNMMLGEYPAGEDIKLSGYQGLHEGFHIWVSNAFSSGSADSVEVFSEATEGTGNSLFRTSYAFGGQTIGRGIGGAGTQILYDDRTDFGRIDRAIWHSYEAFAPLDVDPTGYNDTQDVPQELRVYKLRTADTVVV